MYGTETESCRAAPDILFNLAVNNFGDTLGIDPTIETTICQMPHIWTPFWNKKLTLVPLVRHLFGRLWEHFQTDRQTNIDRSTDVDKKTCDRPTYLQTDLFTDRPTDLPADRLGDRQRGKWRIFITIGKKVTAKYGKLAVPTARSCAAVG